MCERRLGWPPAQVRMSPRPVEAWVHSAWHGDAENGVREQRCAEACGAAAGARAGRRRRARWVGGSTVARDRASEWRCWPFAQLAFAQLVCHVHFCTTLPATLQRCNSTEVRISQGGRFQRTTPRGRRREEVTRAGSHRPRPPSALLHAGTFLCEVFSLPPCGVCLLCGCRWFIL